MLRKYRLGTKIFAGFALMQILLCIVGFVGYSGLSGVTEKTHILEDINQMVRQIYEVRQEEKNFIIRGEKRCVTRVNEKLGRLLNRARTARAAFREKADKEKTDQITAAAEEYADAFRAYVGQAEEKNRLTEEMKAAGRNAMAQAEAIRKDQEDQLARARKNTTERIRARLANTKDTGRLLKWAVDAEGLRIILTYADDFDALMKWQPLNQEIIGLSVDLRTRLGSETGIRQTEAIVSSFREYESLFLDYFATRDREGEMKAIRAHSAAMNAMVAIQTEQTEELERIEEEAGVFLEDRLAKAKKANQVVRQFMDVRDSEKQFIITHNEKHVGAVSESVAGILTLADDLKSRFGSERNIAKIGDVISAMEAYRTAFSKFVGLTRSQALAEQVMLRAARKVEKVCNEVQAGQKATLLREESLARYIMLGTGIITVILACLMAAIITRGITLPVIRTIRGLNITSERVASASIVLASASHGLADTSVRQAASLGQSAASLDKIASIVRINANRAEQADNIMKEAAQVVGQMKNAMLTLTRSMNEISEASRNTSKIIKTINEIAFQTNLLALNATIEAAKAGEAGSGFSVVANEVRSLAMRASDAAEDTTALIRGTLTGISGGLNIVTNTKAAFSEVAEKTEQVGVLVGEIASSSSKEAREIDQLNQSVAQMDAVTQTNSANAQETASTSAEMHTQANRMKSFIDELVGIVGERAFQKRIKDKYNANYWRRRRP